ncbi:Pc18g02020 [Penicillium rubens Wisconsin 54-1255]|uniref:Pc18g02020 protein n=1 Tax=Penicillium rubens (strain ATCC 28089 / DSM 1075 / NRRL 1951 / Wisconsin 54-1255) TaxID=500485 RepID=B6HCP7_PENRW|nr:uncharacterized protein N7525_000784 [Penicillium rubens]KAJ5843043.1 hypothetical protein N7525_000784 [Penicillium rubens]KAJ5846376.1 hypothetical protein N7534_010045 [Penicillium rubens]CAP94426.1 Pc18g02020 [Penicillium rubens Wisconsin 54-1255]
MSGDTSSFPLSSRIASLVHAHFDALPTRSKPTIFPDGSREWIPMTGIVAVKGENTPSESLTCISVTSGAKCLSASHIPRCRGLVLHDCHAEILAIRAFNYWLLTECNSVLSREKQLPNGHDPSASDNQKVSDSPFIQRRKIGEVQDSNGTPPTEWPPFELRPDIKIYMYCTCAPCGDASMELCMAAQEDATPWEVIQEEGPSPKPQDADDPGTETLLDGRAHFSLLGVVRRKPARMDAESTRSKSCSDKLALRQVSSLLSCNTSRLVAPSGNAYLAGLVLPEDEISQVGCDRSFGENGRMQALRGRYWPKEAKSESTLGYRFRPFQVLSVPSEEVAALWPFAKPKSVPCPAISSGQEGDPSVSGVKSRKSRPGNVSAVWILAPSYHYPSAVTMDTGSKTVPTLCRSKTGLYETIINGVKQGNRASSPGARGASSLSRAKLWALFREIAPALVPHACQANVSPAGSLLHASETGDPHVDIVQQRVPDITTYQDFKNPTRLGDPLQIRMQAIRDAKLVLKGWTPNAGDESWGLDVLVDPKKRKR